MDERQARALDGWLAGLPAETVQRYFLLLDELCRGLDVSRHEQFGFLRLRAEFETSGEIFGCTVEELRDRVALRLPEGVRKGQDRPRTPLETLREQVHRRGHPDFR
ncbi:MAG: hypothetical protein HYU87_07395 [Chloroflexi bacterium]|nr:hypothetical protein [Chloroflexota bacterium]